jgi:hypothetical protein
VAKHGDDYMSIWNQVLSLRVRQLQCDRAQMVW